MTNVADEPPARLSWGSYVWPASAVWGEPAAPVLEARERFLRAVREVAPDVLTQLRDAPFTAFVAAHRQKPPRDPASDDIEQVMSLHGAPAPAIAAFEVALEQWARHWQVTADWWLRRAVRALACWRLDLHSPDSDRHATAALDWRDIYSSNAGWAWTPDRLGTAPTWLDWRGTHHHGASMLDHNEMQFWYRGYWEPWAEPRADAIRRMRAAFEDQMHAYIDRLDSLMLTTGWEPTPAKLGSAHFEWLARYQVLGQSYSRLALDVCRERPTVTEAVKDLAAYIDLPLRSETRPGRPRKQPITEK